MQVMIKVKLWRKGEVCMLLCSRVTRLRIKGDNYATNKI